MSIQSEINRISGNVANALTAIANKGVTVPQGSNSDDLATLIGQIQTGGGTGAISIVDTPDAAGGTVRTITAVDISGDTVTAAHLETGYTAHDAQGNAITGTLEPGGGGGGSVSPKQVNFIDYDGTLLYSYTAQEANALTALPANPTHAGLTAQGWNWSLAEIKAQLTAIPSGDVWVGQMYITQSGDTEIDVCFADAARLSPILTICVNGTITVDWGDNTTADTVTGSSLTTRQAPSHTYATPGNYTIKIHVSSGNFTFYGTSNYLLLRKTTTANENRVYSNCVQAVRFGSGITNIGSYAFYYCTSITSVTLPNSVTSLGTASFQYCYNLTSLTIPSSVTSISSMMCYDCRAIANVAIPSGITLIDSSAFYSCYYLTRITIPHNLRTMGGSVFSSCYNLDNITIPSGATIANAVFMYCQNLTSVTLPSSLEIVESTTFQYCYRLRSVTIPSTVTSIGGSVFASCYRLSSVTIPDDVTSIGNYAFQYCYSLASLTIPSKVTSIGNAAFGNCSGIAEYHIKPTTPPTLGTNVFQSIPSDCVIYVPSAKLADYQAAENWSAYASYMQGE